MSSPPERVPKFSTGLTAFLGTSESGAEKVIEEAMRLSNGDDFILVLKPSKGIEDRLIPAYIGALIRKEDGIMHASSLALETLLFIADTMNIGNAIERASGTGNKFVIFASSRALADKISSKLGIKVLKTYRLRLDPKKSSAIAITAARYEK